MVAVFAMPEAPEPIAGAAVLRFPRTQCGPSGAPRATVRGAPRRPGASPSWTSTTRGQRRSSRGSQPWTGLARAGGRHGAPRLLWHRQPPHELVPDAAAAACSPGASGAPSRSRASPTDSAHRSDAGAVAVGLKGPRTIARAAAAMAAGMEAAGPPDRVPGAGDGRARRRAAGGGGGRSDVRPVVAVAQGGVAAERGDTAVRLTPLTDRDADESYASCVVSRCWTAIAARLAWMWRRSSRRCCESAPWWRHTTRCRARGTRSSSRPTERWRWTCGRGWRSCPSTLRSPRSGPLAEARGIRPRDDVLDRRLASAACLKRPIVGENTGSLLRWLECKDADRVGPRRRERSRCSSWAAWRLSARQGMENRSTA